MKKNTNPELRLEWIVGVFVVAIFLGLFVFTIVISGKSLFDKKVFPIEVVLPDAMGLRRNDPVIAKGTTVGSVTDVYYDRDGVHVAAMLEAPVTFHEGYRITVVATSILGGRHLVLAEGPTNAPVVTDVKNLVGAKPADLMEDAAASIGRVREFLETDALSNFTVFSESIRVVGQRLENGEGTLGRLLSTNDAVYADLQSTIADARSIADRLERGEGTLGHLLSSDDSLYTNLHAAVANLNAISGRIERGEGTLGRLLSSDDSLYTNLHATVANLNAISGRLERGEGTLGHLLSSDDSLYTNLTASAENLRSITERIDKGEGLLGELTVKDGQIGRDLSGLLKDSRDLLDDMRETSPVSTFTSIFTSIFFGAF